MPQTTGPSLRTEHKRLTRERLVAAAVEVFTRDGYAATIDDIAAAAGASRATFYLHFSSKSEVVKELISTTLEPQATAVYQRLSALPELTPATLRAWLAESLVYWNQNHPIRTVVKLAALSDPAIARTYEDEFKEMVRLLAEFLVQRGADPRTAEPTATLLIAQLSGMSAFAQLPGFSPDAEGVLDALVRIWARELRVAERAPRQRQKQA